MESDKVKVIPEWLKLTNAIEFRSFHGLTSFYQKFIKDFSQICALLMMCINNGEFK